MLDARIALALSLTLIAPLGHSQDRAASKPLTYVSPFVVDPTRLQEVNTGNAIAADDVETSVHASRRALEGQVNARAFLFPQASAPMTPVIASEARDALPRVLELYTLTGPAILVQLPR